MYVYDNSYIHSSIYKGLFINAQVLGLFSNVTFEMRPTTIGLFSNMPFEKRPQTFAHTILISVPIKIASIVSSGTGCTGGL